MHLAHTLTDKTNPLLFILIFSLWACAPAYASHGSKKTPAPEEILVWGENRSSSQAGYTNPTSILLQEDMASINVATTEDVVKYEPSLVIRRRFIGDANGTLGMRGSNMFQTSRSMVFADGVPLHYFLQSRWSGAPRWTMVSASEIAQVEVIYGPFSAEYSGNAMGGVVVMETAIPQTREVHLDASYFSQDFSAYHFDDTLDGYKTFVSYGDKLGDLSVYASFNRLENKSQPQTFYYSTSTTAQNPQPASGGIDDFNELGNRAIVYGDTGVIDNTTDNFKIKLGYDLGTWQTLLNIAYEDRHSLADSPNSYLRDAAGATIWRGPAAQDGTTFFIPQARFGINEMDRRSLSTGLRLKGELSTRARLEANINRFAILEDETRTSAHNPADPSYNGAGSVSDFTDTGWRTAEVKLFIDDWLTDGLNLISGLRYESYELNMRVFDSDDHASGSKDRKTSHSGGQTDLRALFAQANWNITEQWDASLGGRFESWNSHNGYFSDQTTPPSTLQRIDVPGQDQNKFSPKFSVGYKPDDRWIWRYSLAQAYRFPITEELFLRFRDIRGAGTDADATLQPEDGLHQNMLIERAIAQGYIRGYIRVNLFHETIKNVIENQTNTATSVTTFFPIDEVETRGAELIINAQDVLDDLDIRFNIAYTRSEIIKNAANPALVGKTSPRMPQWRSNLLATYHLTADWDIGGSLQYASDSYDRADNLDAHDQVYGAQDAYTRLGLKTNYRVNDQWKLSAGVDNLTDELSYVAHPWPRRTFYFTLAWEL
ncbi:MAG: TonB-dependent receptor [Cellvibrionaceae bacterium]|nr:TonB-dependent receptor [Cellvibrionaceae bacterium]